MENTIFQNDEFAVEVFESTPHRWKVYVYFRETKKLAESLPVKAKTMETKTYKTRAAAIRAAKRFIDAGVISPETHTAKNTLFIRIGFEDKERLQKQADADHLSLSSYCRQVLLKHLEAYPIW